MVNVPDSPLTPLGEAIRRPPVAAKQILVHQDYMFLIDAAGQLWFKSVDGVKWNINEAWYRVELPASG